MAIKPSNIFLLELIVDDITTWNLPEGLLECDESCVDFLFLDTIQLSMCEKDFGFPLGKYGKNCIFVLDQAPDDKHQITIQVFKKLTNNEKTLIGNGSIPINEIFQTFFQTIFPFVDVTPSPSTNLTILKSDAELETSAMPVEKSPSGTSKKSLEKTKSQTSKKSLEKSSSAASKKSLEKSKSQTSKAPSEKNTELVQDSKTAIAPEDKPSVDVEETPSKEDDKIPPKEDEKIPPKEDEINSGNLKPTAEDPPKSDEKVADNPNTSISDPPNEVEETPDNSNEQGTDAPTPPDPQDPNRQSAGGGSFFPSDKPTGPPTFPISNMKKAMYPLIMEKTQIGVICILIRLTCFGSTIVSPFQFGQNHNAILLKNNDDGSSKQFYKYSKMPAVPERCDCGKIITVPCEKIFSPIEIKCGSTKIGIQKNVKDKRSMTMMMNKPKRIKHQCDKMVQKSKESVADCDCIDLSRNIVSSMHEICEKSIKPIINKIENDIEKCDVEKDFDEDSCPCPPTSLMNFGGKEYDEYSADVNQNALTIRVGKESQLVTQIFEDDEDDDDIKENCNNCFASNSQKKLKLQCQDDGNNILVQIPSNHAKIINTYDVPVIKGNRKYPSRFKARFQMPDCVDVVKDYKVTPTNCCIRANDLDAMQITGDKAVDSYPPGIEVCKTDCSNPTCDVFLLKLGKSNASGKNNQIELELRTPKSPRATLSTPKDTRAAQTYEEEFEPIAAKKPTEKPKGGKKKAAKGKRK